MKVNALNTELLIAFRLLVPIDSFHIGHNRAN